MKAKILRHFYDINERPGDMVDVTSIDKYGYVYVVVSDRVFSRPLVKMVNPNDVEIVYDGADPLRMMIVIMSVSAVIGLLLFVISELIHLNSLFGFMLCMSGYVVTFVVLKSVARL
jgi:hypothetical protein